MPRTTNASAIIERWQRHGTASAHMIAVGFCFASWMSFSKDSAKRRCLHVIGETSKRCIAPASIRRIAMCMTQTTQRFHVPVAEVPIVQRFAQRFAVELRIVPRTGNRAHINQSLNTVCPQNLHQVIKASRRVAHSENSRC